VSRRAPLSGRFLHAGREAGDPCPAYDTCQALLGIPDVTCDAATSTCTAPVVGQAGEQCGDFSGVLHLCGYGLTCRLPDSICVPRPAIGEPCGNYFMDNGCGAGAICFQGKCAKVDPALCVPPGFPP
jgi:hypothetical protein